MPETGHVQDQLKCPRAGVSKLAPKLRMVFIIFLMIRGKKLKDYYFMTNENYMEFKFQCP